MNPDSTQDCRHPLSGENHYQYLKSKNIFSFLRGCGSPTYQLPHPRHLFYKVTKHFSFPQAPFYFFFTSEFVTILLPTLSRFYFRLCHFCSSCRIRTYDDLHVRQGLYHWAKELLSCVFGVRTRLTFLMRESSFPLSHAIYVVRGGFEPPLHVPKTCVLPLDDPTI